MRELLRWGVPGLVLAGPLDLFLKRCGVAPPWPVLLIAAVPIGFVLQQIVRWHFEARDNGHRSPQRAALAVIIERGHLAQRSDCGDLAYQVYESVFYQRPEWQAIRDHAHRCHEHRFLSRSIALACAAGTLLSLLGMGAQPCLAVLYLLALPPVGMVLCRKGQQTIEALELFDRAVVLANWPLYDAALRAIIGDVSRTDAGAQHAAPGSESPRHL